MRYHWRMNIIILQLMLLSSPTPASVAQFRPCVWPNTCVAAPVLVVAVPTTCQWPNTCG